MRIIREKKNRTERLGRLLKIFNYVSSASKAPTKLDILTNVLEISASDIEDAVKEHFIYIKEDKYYI